MQTKQLATWSARSSNAICDPARDDCRVREIRYPWWVRPTSSRGRVELMPVNGSESIAALLVMRPCDAGRAASSGTRWVSVDDFMDFMKGLLLLSKYRVLRVSREIFGEVEIGEHGCRRSMAM